MHDCPGVVGVLAIDVLVQATWRSTWSGWFCAQTMQTFEKQPRKPQRLQFWKAMKNPSLFTCPCYSPDGSQRIALSVYPSGNTSSGQGWCFHFTAHSLWCNLPDLPVGWCFSFAASFTSWNSVSSCMAWKSTLMNVTCPYATSPVVIRLQGAQFWCNYTSFELLMPWKIFTQFSHNHSGTAVDTELHTARHTPAVGYIIFLQRCSGDPSVSSLAHQLMKFGWMKTAWLCIMKGCSISFIKKCTLSFNFHKIPKIISGELVPLFLSRILCCVLCILYMFYELCESFHAL